MGIFETVAIAMLCLAIIGAGYCLILASYHPVNQDKK